MPQHSHAIWSGYGGDIGTVGPDAYRFQWWAKDNQGWHYGQLGTSSEGGNVAHNNMPPFHTCYIWRRTA